MGIALLFCSLFWGAGNRLWGWSQGNRWIGLLFIASGTGIIAASIYHDGWQIPALAFTATLSFFLGRLHDGVEGTYWQKALRGFLYSGIPISFSIISWSWIPLLVIPLLPLNGLIAWACSKLPVTDYTMVAECITGFLLGMAFLTTLVPNSIPYLLAQ